MRKIRLYIFTSILGFLMVLGICYSKDLFSQIDYSEKLKILCDAFFIPAVIFLGFGILIRVSNEGIFDILGYSFGTSKGEIQKIFSRKNTENKKINVFRAEFPDFFTYTQVKRKKNVNSSFMIIVGAIFFIVSLCLNVLFSFYSPHL